jgi:hypothetical protein
VVNFHAKLMVRYGIDLLDARPRAWELAATVFEEPIESKYCRTWLTWEFEKQGRVVVKDPRTGWFLPMWLACADEVGLTTGFITPLRHPTEVLSSVRTTDRDRQTEASRAAWWVNMMLHTELQTRDRRRAYVSYEDLLADWRKAVGLAEEALGFPVLSDATPQAIADVDDLVDPSLRRAARGWDAVDVPSLVRDLADETWTELLGLSQPGGDTAQRRERLDELRTRYVDLYTGAEAMVDSTFRARRRPPRRRDDNEPQTATSPQSLGRRVLRRARRAAGALRRRVRR